MLRFTALAWDHDDATSSASARCLMERMQAQSPSFGSPHCANGLAIFLWRDSHGAHGVYRIERDRGFVIGRLFERPGKFFEAHDGAQASVSFSTPLSTARVTRLSEHYWGPYISFLQSSSDGSVQIIVDPTGETPCQILRHGRVTLLFSHVTDILSVVQQTLSIDWRFVGGWLVDPTFQARETGLKDVTQLLPGESLRVAANGDQHRSLDWNLFEIARAAPIDDLPAAASLARRTIGYCVEAWASAYPILVQALSGGLDSSIVLACLAQARSRPEVTCLNLHDPSTGGDERRFARLAAEASHSTLTERAREVDRVDLDGLRRIGPSALPAPSLAYVAYRTFYEEVAVPRGAALCTGIGGDYVFCRTGSVRPAVDFVHSHLFGRGFLSAIQDHTGSGTYWATTWEAIVAGVLRMPETSRAHSGARRFISADVVTDAETQRQRLTPPLWQQSVGYRSRHALAPGKRRHLETLHFPARMTDPFLTDASARPAAQRLTWIAPLLSQPVIELFARIPTYLLKAGGIERAVARKAFARDLPEALIQRRSKGVTNQFIFRLFREREDFFRDLLLDGELAKRGLLDRARMARYFDTAHDGYAEGFSTLLGAHADLEIWVRRWQAINSPAAEHPSLPDTALRARLP